MNMQTNSEAKLVDCIVKFWDKMPDAAKVAVVASLAGGYLFNQASNFLDKASVFIKEDFPVVEECLSNLIAKFQCDNNTIDTLGCCDINDVVEVPAS